MLKKGILAYLSIVLLSLAICEAAGEVADQTGDSILLSNTYLWKGHQYFKQGRTDLAAEAFRTASGHMRASPYPHFMLARLYLKRSPMDAVLEFGTGVKLLTGGFFYQSILVSNLLLTALLAVAIAAYVAVLVVLVRHVKTVWFSILLTFSPVVGEKYLGILVAGCLVSFLTMLSGLSIVAMVTWAIVIGCGLAWRHASGSERRTMAGFVVFLIAFVPLFDLTVQVVSTQHPDSPTRIAALAGETTEAEIAKVAETNKVLSENDPIGEFMRGLLYLKNGEYVVAIEHFNLASKFTRNNAAILNNIAVAFHNLGRYKEAQAKFEGALKFGPREALIHYNYSQTLNALLYYDLAQGELTKASGLDFDLTRSLVTGKERPTLIPMNLETGVLWELAMNPSNKMLKSAYHPTEAGWPGILLLVLLTASAFVLMKNAKLPARCDICECVVKAQVIKRKRREVLCPACKAIKQQNADDNDALEKQLEQRVTNLETHHGIFHLVLGLVLPGSTYHLLGSKMKGFLLSVVVFMLLIIMVTSGGPVKQVPELDLGHNYGWAVVLFIAVYALYAWRSVMLVLRTQGEE